MAQNNYRNDDLDSEKSQVPSASVDTSEAHAEIVADLQMISEVFQKIEEETAQTADEIFDWLVNVDDEHIIWGTIPESENANINKYIKILNRLFSFSRQKSKGGFRIISRNVVERLDKKTFAICMCHDGGTSLDILCDIVNTENQARTPTASPVKVTIKQAFVTNSKDVIEH